MQSGRGGSSMASPKPRIDAQCYSHPLALTRQQADELRRLRRRPYTPYLPSLTSSHNLFRSSTHLSPPTLTNSALQRRLAATHSTLLPSSLRDRPTNTSVTEVPASQATPTLSTPLKTRSHLIASASRSLNQLDHSNTVILFPLGTRNEASRNHRPRRPSCRRLGQGRFRRGPCWTPRSPGRNS